MSSGIEWTDETWNPLVGCSKVGSPGCSHCYAINVAHRGLSPQHRGLTVVTDEGPDWTGEVREVPHKLDEPLVWSKPRRVFVNSLSDLFHPEVAEAFIAEVFVTMARTPQHTYQILTKRPQRMAQVLDQDLLVHVHDEAKAEALYAAGWPLPNVWLGTSIESDRYAWRADVLRSTPAAVRWISAEPLLGPLPSLDLTGIDWLVVGGESGPGARPMHPQWARDLRDRGSAASVPFFFKQWGEWVSQADTPEPFGRFRGIGMDEDGTVYEGVRALGRTGLYRMGKRNAPRTLDGATWDQYPKEVYEHLAWLTAWLAERGIPVHRVDQGNIRADALDSTHRFASMPLFVVGKGGKRGMIRRQCTREYKIKPVQSKLRELVGLNPRQRAKDVLVEQWVGISLDEVERVSDSRVPWIRNRHPLVFDLRMSRWDCEVWLHRHGVKAPRSACIGCPFHSDAEWRHIRDTDPEAWADAVQFDRAIRSGAIAQEGKKQLLSEAYLHPQMVPLDEVDLTTEEERGQGRLFIVRDTSPAECGISCDGAGLPVGFVMLDEHGEEIVA